MIKSNFISVKMIIIALNNVVKKAFAELISKKIKTTIHTVSKITISTIKISFSQSFDEKSFVELNGVTNAIISHSSLKKLFKTKASNIVKVRIKIISNNWIF